MKNSLESSLDLMMFISLTVSIKLMAPYKKR